MKLTCLSLCIIIICSIYNCSYCSAAMSYIQGEIKEIHKDSIIVTDTKANTVTIYISKKTYCYDCSKKYGPESRSDIKSIPSPSNATIAVELQEDGNYSAKGIIFLANSSQMDPTWQKKMSQGNSQPSANQNTTDYKNNSSTLSPGYQPDSQGAMPHTEGIVTGIDKNSGKITVQTLQGQQFSGVINSNTMIYDLSTTFSLNSTSTMESISSGDVISITSTNPSSSAIDVVMFLPKGKNLDSTWQQIYEGAKTQNP